MPDPTAPAPPPPPSLAVTVDGRLAEDRHCIQCGYNLRTLAIAGRCPECNTAVEQSLAGLDLVHAPLDWLRRIERGFLCLRLATLLLLASLVLPISLSAITRAATAEAGWVTVLGALLAILLFALLGVGFFLATVPEPRVRALGEGWPARRIARWSAGAALARARQPSETP